MMSVRSFLVPVTLMACLLLASCWESDGEQPGVASTTAATASATIAIPGALSGSSTIGGAGELAVVYNSLEQIARDADAIVVLEFTTVNSQMYSRLPFTVGEAVVRESLSGPLQPGETITYGELGAPIYVGGSKLDPSATIVSRVPASGGIHWIEPGESYLIFLVGPTHIGPVREGGYAPLGAYQGKFRLLDGGILEFDPDMSWEDSFTVPKLLDGKNWTDIRAELRKILASNP